MNSQGDPVLTPLEELQLENEQLKLQTIDLQNQIDMLNQIIMEQIKVIYDWVLER